MSERVVTFSLHTFYDASKMADAAVFARYECSTCVQVQLIQAKTRVPPVKTITIPRLELLAATIGTRLATSIVKELEQKDITLSFWGDSSTVISWIKRDGQWGLFCVEPSAGDKRADFERILATCTGVMNPADLPSRGCTVPQLLRLCGGRDPSGLNILLKTGLPENHSQMRRL